MQIYIQEGPVSHKFPVQLLSSALMLATLSTGQAQTLVEQVGVTQINSTLTQFTAPILKVPTVIPQSSVPADTSPDGSPAPGAAQASPTTTLGLPAKPPTPAFMAGLKVAQQNLQARNYRQAQTQFEALVSQNYQNPQAHFGLGLSLFGLNDLQGARFEFGQLAALNPAGFEGPYNLGVVADRQGQSAEALTLFIKAAELARGKVNPAVMRQILDAQAGEQARKPDYQALVLTLTEMVKNEPNDLELQYRQAQALAFGGQGKLALPVLFAVRQKQPSNIDAALLTAEIFAAQRLPDRAIRELDSAIAVLKPAGGGVAQARLLVRKASLLGSAGRSRDALAAAQSAVAADKRSAAAQAALGEALYARNDRPAALAAWKAAAALEPKNALYLANQAVVELAMGQTAQAVQNAQKASIMSDDATAQTSTAQARAEFVLGVAAYNKGDYAEARASLTSSALKAPSGESSLWLGLASYAQKDYAGAVTALQDSLKVQPSTSTQLSLGSALISAGRYADAETTIRPLVLSDAGNAEAWYQLGLARRALGREQEALASFRTAATLGNVRAKTALKQSGASAP
jgi:tetratricopeptide (TPR) repeat protein